MKADQVKAAIGYEKAGERDRCGNCRHVDMRYADRAPPFDRAWLVCGKHGFATTAGSLCMDFERKRSAIAPPPL